MQWAIEQGDVVEWARTYQGVPFHALLCDPPYEYKFMGRAWDGSGVAFNPETWAALTTHLHPGAFGMAFASSRGWHRLAAAIEDAGLIIHPSIFGWSNGSGFPKATRVPDERFNGHRYGLQAMKPALEPIIVFQKPYAGKPAECIAETGAGALWIDGARIGTDTITTHGGSGEMKNNEIYGSYKELERGSNERVGRWPANLALVHSPGCNGSCVAGCPVREMDLQAGDRPTFGSKAGDEPSPPMSTVYSGGLKSLPWQTYNDAGGPSRFFFNADWMHERLESENPVFYTGKATSAERDAGLGSPAVIVSDGRTKPIDNPYLRGETPRRNPHPTIKPLSLVRWLATLLLPPIEYAPRRLLVPFSGAGSEMIGAGLAGWEFCQGIELNQGDDYIAIAEARLKHWLENPLVTVTQKNGESATIEQMRLL